ncbi:MAG: spore cortex biosynthesis protein YabQ [Halanaerobiaceae bacterium]
MLLLLEQIRSFFWMFLFGFFTGAIFNIYQVCIHRKKIKRPFLHILDILFSLLIGLSGFILLLYVNFGVVRFYVILAIILGFSIYYSLSRIISKVK